MLHQHALYFIRGRIRSDDCLNAQFGESDFVQMHCLLYRTNRSTYE